MKENCRGGTRTPWSTSGHTPCVCPVSKHSSSGFNPGPRSSPTGALPIFQPYVFGNTMSKTNDFRFSEYFE